MKTIEDLPDIKSIGRNDALSENMSDSFDVNASGFSYKATVPEILHKTRVDLPRESKPKHIDRIKADPTKSTGRRLWKIKTLKVKRKLIPKSSTNPYGRGWKNEAIPAQK